MGYEFIQKRPRRELFQMLYLTVRKKLSNEEVDEAVNDNVDNVVNDNIRYWRGPKRANSYSKLKRTYSNPASKILTHRDEFLLILMRLRFGNALVVWLPREAIRDNLPDTFIKTGHPKYKVIIDCTDVFIAKPKSLLNQAATWFHNILFYCYGGRASDRYITKDRGFYELLERDNKVMADRGFQIREELLLKFCSLSVPPGARIKSQMISIECKKTKEIANPRIHVERVINHVKFYPVLKTVLPITMMQHGDDIVKACAAPCNLKPRFMR
ncbi:uncharacterized protein LOC130628681 [Hydractinia symbiolongicarpus]|uniref:uncharacterized protein LOC130628681 n=1 Tax=Hydractinia symbiolongicarpus TaxID=13093 RepID=UPI00254C553B|nr:uncharacterized protein LOC130628681 [Hydractinia symbiolongicarpus]